MVHRWRIFGDFLRPAFPASRVHHISNLHSKFALGPQRHTMCRSMVDIHSATAVIKRGKRRKKKEERKKKTGRKYNVRICYAGRP